MAAVHFKKAETEPALKLWLEALDEDPRNPVAILGRGELKAAFQVRVHRVTASAKSKIEAAGGSVELIA
jgi:ribosomal protein L15